MNQIIKMKRSIFLLGTILIVGSVELLEAALDVLSTNPIIIQKISSKTLEKERMLFEKFIDNYCSICGSQPLDQKIVGDAFRSEEQSYLEADPATLFFHALHEDQVIGYISCNLLPGYHVCIRQLAFDPAMFDVSLVRELLFAIFSSVPKVKLVTICCSASCLDLAMVFEELGFVHSVSDIRPINRLYEIYELKINPKCKICNVLYADIWDLEEDIDSDWSDSCESIDDELSWNHQEARAMSLSGEELNDIS